jgi:hypothetical protein
MKPVLTLLKSAVASLVLANPFVLETVLKYPVIANAILTPARVVVLVSNLSIRKR